jgi:hypothetical protein
MATPTENWQKPSSFTSLYHIWEGIKQRCLNPNSKDYSNYGGRGITICARWINSFESFAHDMGPRPGTNYSIERENNDGPYSPDNCRWATMREQRLNARTTVWLEHNGERLPLTIWAERLGIKRKTMTERYRQYGLDAEKLLRPQGKHTGRGHRYGNADY